MGRYTGKTVINYTYNVDDYRPLDTRMLVPTYDDLINESNWLIKGDSNAYNGMIVAVGSNTADLTKNGIYYLFDAEHPGKEDVPDVTKSDNWHKLGDLDIITKMAGSDSTEISTDANGALKINVNNLVQRLNNDDEVLILLGGDAKSL